MFNVIFNLKEWSNVSGVPDNVEFTDFNFEVKRKTKMFLSAGFSRNFIRNSIENFNKDKNDYIIPEWLFDERNLIILRQLFSERNEKPYL